MSQIRILLAEDHVLVRKGIHSLLSEEADIAVVGEASTGFEAVRSAEKLLPDIVLMDINMPDLNGLEATRQIRKLLPAVKVIMLTMYKNEEYVLQTLQAGAVGYLLKQSIPSELITAIHAVQAGDAFLSPSISKSVIEEYVRHATTEAQPDNYGRLTDREREVMQLMVEGYSTKEIAEKLFISSKTVGVHRGNLMEKLQLQTVPDLVKYALRKGIIRLD